MAAKYLTMVGQLQCLVTLGRFDLHAHVATMPRFRAAPRQGHVDRLNMPIGLRIIQLCLELTNLTTLLYQTKLLLDIIYI